MKFIPSPKDEDQKKPVAYIDWEGDLVIRVEDSGRATAIGKDGNVYHDIEFKPHFSNNNVVFYPGDSVTIEF